MNPSPILHLPTSDLGNNYSKGTILTKLQEGLTLFNRNDIDRTNLQNALTEYVTYIEMLKTKITDDDVLGGSRRFRRSRRRFRRSRR